MKGYLSVREISYKWSASERWVSKLAQDGRIPGVERFGRSWAIPVDAEKPADPRKEKRQKGMWKKWNDREAAICSANAG